MKINHGLRALAPLIALLTALCWPAAPALAGPLATLVPELKKSVVNLRVSNSRYFEVNEAGIFYGTGFIVDNEAGLVATNRHVAHEYPSQIEVTFHDGVSTLGQVVYYDPWHDFSVVRYDPSKLKERYPKVKLGDFFDLKIGDPVLLIGNNEGEEYSVKEGRVVSLTKNKSDRHSHTFQTSFDRTGGSSGSPVWTTGGKVVGIHFRGTDTSSFELPINYLTDRLPLIKNGNRQMRGDVGLQLDLIKIADAEKYLRLPARLARELYAASPEAASAIFVKSVIQGSPAAEVLRPGDLIQSVDGKTIGDNLYLFDRLVDGKTGGKVEIRYHRLGKPEKALLDVRDVEAAKIRKFLLFGGGTLHDLTHSLKLYYDIRVEGVYLAQASPGSTMDNIGKSSSKVLDRKGVVITAIAGEPVKTLDDAIRVVKGLRDDQSITVSFKDFYYSSPPEIRMVTLNLKTTPTVLFELDAKTSVWSQHVLR